MNRKTSVLLGLALTLLASLPASAQKIIAVQVKVDNLSARTTTKYALGEAVPVNVGDRVRVNLVGTEIVRGTGVETPVDARFAIGSGSDAISIGQPGANSIVVEIRRGGGDGRAQLTYTAAAKYDMAHNRDGRITFQIGDTGGGTAPVTTQPGGRDQSRQEKALRLTNLLYRAILNQDASGPQGEQDVNRVYQGGYRALRDVGSALARQAENSGQGRSHSDRGYQEQDSVRVGDLYRQLLKRTDGYQSLRDHDAGFRGNVNVLHEKGLVAVVQSIIDSQEFVNAHAIGRFDAI